MAAREGKNASMSFGGALAIFVKTPELSPVKTRLAASVGPEKSREFYERSLVATRSLAKKMKENIPGLQVYWAVAERAGVSAERWADFPVIFQGEGGLGARLDFVYRELLSRHQFVCFIGADSPHLYSHDLEQGILITAKNLRNKFVIGETLDGGFYFFGGSFPVPPGAWVSVEYSTVNTSSQLISALHQVGKIEFIRKNFDIDTGEDLNRLREESFSKAVELLPEQVDLINWIRVLA